MQNIIIDDIIADIQQAHAKGVQTFEPGALLKYLKTLKEEKTEAGEIDHQKALKNLEFNNQANLAMFQSVIDAGKEALRASLILNGGAAIAVMALIGNLPFEILKIVASPTSWALYTFSIAALTVVMAFGIRYVSQNYYSREDSQSWGDLYNYLSVFLTVLGYFLFILGAILMHQGFSSAF